jgi:ribosomal protein S6--L-glutamate ligase
MKIVILTAEPKNFVPVELLKAAQAAELQASIVDISKIVVDESLGGGALWAVGEEGLEALTIDAETIVIPRLNEHHLDTKIGILKKMENMGAKLLNTAEGMELCNDKLMSQVVLNKAGIETPKSWVLQDADSFDMVIGQLDERKAISFPLIVKTFRGTHGIGVMKLDSKSSLVSVGQTLLKEGIAFMLQEFIKHEQSCRIIMKGQELLAANLRGQPKEKDEFRTNSHLGSETQPYEPNEQELALGRKIVELFGTEFCAIDYIVVDTATKGEDLPATEGLVDGHLHVMVAEDADPATAKYVRYSKERNRWEAIKGQLSEEEAQKVVNSQLTEGKRIIVLEVNGSPGLEAMSKNWPDRNLAAEVISYAMTKAEAVQADMQVKTTEVPPTPADPEGVTPDEHDKPTDANALSLVEPIIIHRVADEPIEAKVDTGARTSSLHVDDIEVQGDTVRFRRGEVTYRVPLSDTRHVKSHDGKDESIERPIVKLDATVKGVRANGIEFSLIDRGHMQYQVLIGRNLISQLGFPVAIEQDETSDGAPASNDVIVDGSEEE